MADDLRSGTDVETARLNLLRLAESLGDLARSMSVHSQYDQRAGADRSVVPYVALARRMLADIRQRERKLPASIFGDPAWNLALDLYVAACEGKAVSIGSAIIAAGVPPTTGLRLISAMVEHGHLLKKPHPFDRRQSLLTLSEQLLRSVEEHLTSVASRWGVEIQSPLQSRIS